MKIAFLFSAYTDPEHLRRLLSVLPEGSEAFLHIDAKSDIAAFRAVVQGPHVHYLEERYNVVWGSFQQTQYQMALIRAALQSGIAFDYLFTMSGMEYPIWSNHHIEQYLTEQRAQRRELLMALRMTAQSPEHRRLYVRHWPFNNYGWRPGSLLSKLRVSLRTTLFTLGWRKPLAFEADGHHYELYKGSDWFGITPELGAFVLERWDSSPQLQAYFRDSFTPSETAIHTIAFNSDFAARCLFSEGEYTRLADLTPLTFIDYVPGTVGTLDESYFDTLIQSGKMFCRKVVTGSGDKLMALLDRHRESSAEGTA